MEKPETRLIQGKILEIFKEVDRICRENQLRYYAIGGTCIGAVRHHGFIPWDDDLDIAMPREDYEAFIKAARTSLPPNMEVYDEKKSRHYLMPYIKVHDVNTTLVEDWMFAYKDRYSGVFVDIMPLDGLPEGALARRIHFKCLWLLGRLNRLRRIGVTYPHKGVKLVLMKILAFMIKAAPYNAYSKLREKIQRKYSFEGSRYSCYGWSEYAERIMFQASDFSDYLELPFEDYVMRVPNGYDDFLTIMFGNYMELPPEADRVSKHPAFVDLARPYSFYQQAGINADEMWGGIMNRT